MAYDDEHGDLGNDDVAENRPNPAHLHMTLIEQMLGVIRHIVDTVPAAAGAAPTVRRLERLAGDLRDIVMPPPPKPEPPPEPEAVESGPDHSADETLPPPPPLDHNHSDAPG